MKAKLENNYWVIGSNKWTASIYTQEEAEMYSTTLIDCENCIDCFNCVNCMNCISCRNCSACYGLSDSSFCRGCSDLRSCTGFKSNPQRITSPILGDKNTQTTYYWNDEKEQIVCVFFQGGLKEFEAEVKEIYGNNEIAKGYLNWIKAVKQYKEAINEK
jgi:hypothetical protein